MVHGQRSSLQSSRKRKLTMVLSPRNNSFASSVSALLIGTLVIASRMTYAAQYGVDVSFPIHRKDVSTNYAWLPHNTDPANNPTPDKYKDMPVQPLGDRQSMYVNWMQGCRDYAGNDWELCDDTERDRIKMNLEQPQLMVNFTRLGFKKIKAPEEVFSLLKVFWETNKENAVEEEWPTGYTYVNNWDIPTLHVSVDDMSLKGAGGVLKKSIWTAASDAMEEWTGQKVKPSSLYGIRVYQEGHFLATHVDRLPLVTSAIINVAQEGIDEPWPLEVIGFDGQAYNVTMQPGDMVLYESHSLLHGRPFPLKGKLYANIFVHFIPTDDFSDEEGVPPYVLKDSPAAEKYWNKQRGEVDSQIGKVESSLSEAKDDETLAHVAVKTGDLDLIKTIASDHPSQLHKKDRNGWVPLHEAARFGNGEIVEFLIGQGADIDVKTNDGKTPLDIAVDTNGKNHPIVKLLERLGKLGDSGVDGEL